MSAIFTCVCFLLWIRSTQSRSPDPVSEVTVSCLVAHDCTLPCIFHPASDATVVWFRQDVMVYKLALDEDEDDDDDDDDDDDKDSGEVNVKHEQFAERVSVSPSLVSRGNASLTLRKCGLKDRGTYRCHVKTSKGEDDTKVILKVEAPIRGLSLALSRMSGYEEMICTIDNVYPAPRVTWTTEPSTFENLRAVTRMHINKDGLYMLNSRLRLLKGQPNLIYICTGTTPYGGPAWTSSLRERKEIKGPQGKDLTIPCLAPLYLTHPTLEWSFHNGPDTAHILTFNSQQGHSTFTPPWERYVELDGYSVPFGDGSLRLMDPETSKHTGSYTCVFSMQYSKHMEHTDVIIDGSAGEGEAGRQLPGKPSYWWVAGLVIAVLALAVVGLLVYMKLKVNRDTKPRHDPEEATELNMVKDASESSAANKANVGT